MADLVTPRQKVRVLIIDDVKNYVDSIKAILGQWPNLEVEEIIFDEEDPEIPACRFEVDILLLDEGLGDFVTGTQLYNSWKEIGYQGVTVSITGDRKPEYVNYHFKRKASLDSKADAVEEFIALMNQVLSGF